MFLIETYFFFIIQGGPYITCVINFLISDRIILCDDDAFLNIKNDPFRRRCHYISYKWHSEIRLYINVTILINIDIYISSCIYSFLAAFFIDIRHWSYWHVFFYRKWQFFLKVCFWLNIQINVTVVKINDIDIKYDNACQ